MIVEPTTGLDATTANNVMKTLRKLANDGRCIICSIHQPRYKIFDLFDHLILLAKGEAVYSGPAEVRLRYK
jgi:ATP-binding cassette subfamily G (WHITE) protein 2